MGRIVAIDYGRKRTGLAVTDPLQMIAGALDTVPTHTLMDFLKKYLPGERSGNCGRGHAAPNGRDSFGILHVYPSVRHRLQKEFPDPADRDVR